METLLCLAKPVVDAALSKAKSTVEDEVALQLGVQSDLAFIRDEFEMMQTFLLAADEQDPGQRSRMIKVWVQQVHDLAYDVEDCLQDFAVRLEGSQWWRFLSTMGARRRIAKEIKELKAKVEHVSQRNLRYHTIDTAGSSTAAATAKAQSSAAILGIHEARRAAKQGKQQEVDLMQLITKDQDKDLRVISVWGTNDDLGKTSIIKKVYDDPEIHGKFECRAWVKLMHPFNPNEFFKNLVRQFYGCSASSQERAAGFEVLKKMGEMEEQARLADVFERHVNEKSYLIVIDGMSTIVEWEWIKTYLPDKKNGSRVIVSTQQVEIASLCPDQPYQASELKQLSSDQFIYLFFFKKDSQQGSDDSKPGPSSKSASTSVNSLTEIQEDPLAEMDGRNMYSNSVDGQNLTRGKTMDPSSAAEKKMARSRTMATALEESHLIGRTEIKNTIINFINEGGDRHQVISVQGMGGLGKTTLVKGIFESQELGGKFKKRVWITVSHPFNQEQFFRNLAVQLHTNSPKEREAIDFGMLGDSLHKKLAAMGPKDLIDESNRLLKGEKYFLVLDDLSSMAEWELIIPHLPKEDLASCIIITTRKLIFANRCSIEYNLQALEDDAAFDLFKRKVFKEAENIDIDSEMTQYAKHILKKCGGLPLAITTIGGFLATKPKTLFEWRKLNEHISVELEINPNLEPIWTVLTSIYDALPYHLKPCFLYSSIFPEDHTIRRRRLVRRWIAEGYSKEMRDMTVEEVGEGYFNELIDRSIIQPSNTVTLGSGRNSWCQVHDLIREIGISKLDENLIFILDNRCNMNTQDKVRHLTISSSWDRDKNVFESIVDSTHLRSLTVFGEWKPFFISDKMRFLRVLDLEDTEGLLSYHLKQIRKLLHLKYLSLRGCFGVFYLPNSMGNLRQLQTLDVRGTSIRKLPRTITKLRKLQYLRAGLIPNDEEYILEDITEDLPNLLRGKPATVAILLCLVCISCCAPQFFEDDRHVLLNFFCRLGFLAIRLVDVFGVKVPRGIGKLKALHTVGVVNIAQGKATLKDLKKLTKLRKLGVTGINKRNCKELCSVISNLSCLESLSIRSEQKPGLEGCLDVTPFSPPKSLQSLKLYGNLVRLPGWIKDLHNLVKLNLRSTRLEYNSTIQVLGGLSNLVILRFWEKSFENGEPHLCVPREAFTSLTVLELANLLDLESVKFELGAMPKLELLQVDHCSQIGFSGLTFLSSLKQVSLKGDYNEEFKKNLLDQLDKNPNRPILKME